jgi:hypothetical protein
MKLLYAAIYFLRLKRIHGTLKYSHNQHSLYLARSENFAYLKELQLRLPQNVFYGKYPSISTYDFVSEPRERLL